MAGASDRTLVRQKTPKQLYDIVTKSDSYFFNRFRIRIERLHEAVIDDAWTVEVSTCAGADVVWDVTST